MAAATKMTLLILKKATAKTKQKRPLAPKLKASPLVQMVEKSQTNLLVTSQTTEMTLAWSMRKLLLRRNPKIH